ncbi:hypothetical protein EVAR_14631_1 [Eumeta japonica]|uniref:Uncharacterized protein n=1 Tax=Eumeta variegata TaxID=151549 RepID=A0A4C1U248_EUMVA|nr:hypothetical protein EVAR_14631_1 [Eumeta japonica]
MFEIGYESVEDLDSQTLYRLAVVGPHSYTDGSPVEGKVEMVALQRAIRRVKNGKDGLVSIFNDSRSSLEVLTSLKTYCPLAHENRRHISEIAVENRVLRLFWVRAHARIADNEHAGGSQSP